MVKHMIGIVKYELTYFYYYIDPEKVLYERPEYRNRCFIYMWVADGRQRSNQILRY